MTPPTSDRVRLIVFPYYTDNPWQAIVYRSFTDAGGEVSTLESLDELDAARADAVAAGVVPVLHLNWTTPISQAVHDVVESMDRVRRAIAAVRLFTQAGGRTLWTIHNVLPHETRFLLPELILCRALAESVDRVMVMNPATVEAVQGLYPVDPEKVTQIDFPSYLGVYPEGMDRVEARARLGLATEDHVTAFIGVIRPYKGLEDLLEAFDILWEQDPRQRLLIGGKPGGSYTEADLERVFHPRPYLRFHPSHVPDDEIQTWMAAADVIALPYLRGLNVSVLLLAATFGRPVALRALPELAYLGDEPWVQWIAGRGEELATTFARAQSTLTQSPGVEAAARRYAEDRAPGRISDLYRDEILRVAGVR